jgi:hypothetical protein
MTRVGNLTIELRHKGQKRDMSSSLDCDSQAALMLGASAGLTTRAYLAPIADTTLQQREILIVDNGCIFRAELANFAAAGKTPSPASEITHAYVLLIFLYLLLVCLNGIEFIIIVQIAHTLTAV